MPLMFIPPIESHADNTNTTTYWHNSNKTLVIGRSREDSPDLKLKDAYAYDTADTTSVPWSDYKGTFTGVRFVGNITPATTKDWFSGFTKLGSIAGIQYLDTSLVKDMTSMFEGCSVLTSLDVSGFNTSSVTKMQLMFQNCNKLGELDVSGFDTSNVTTMERMFKECNNVKVLDVSKFDTSKVGTMASMFQSCSELTELDLSSFEIKTTSTVLRL